MASPKVGSNSHIDIYLRVRPVKQASACLALDSSENRLEFNIPRTASQGYVNNQREHYEFRFNGTLGAEAKQDEVFEKVARPVGLGALQGFNGTVFAYGQTGSGKTFTVTGGPERYVDRGIIPRSISLVFGEVAKRGDYQYTVHISYLEIYNETGYDLLNPEREVQMLEDLPKVAIMEDEESNIHMRNLSIHRANNEEEALNLLFLGDTNRTISETPMNMASSRSHCVFTIYVEARQAGEETVRRSKLNLVDLAGSERVSKTNIDGTILREAKFINLSLHYLEQVIIALQERSMGQQRPHVPYRNSMMTQVLRDSLGGNCRTVMIANITAQHEQLDESISTCRFAQRVAMVSNQVVVNEEVDPSLVIKRLKQEIRDLKDEIRLLKGEGGDRGPLTPDELTRLQSQLDAWVSDSAPGAMLELGGSMLHIRAALDMLKKSVRQGGGRKLGAGKDSDGGDAPEQLRKLQLQVQQRDNEINILVSMLKKREAAMGLNAAPALQSGLAPSLHLPMAPAHPTPSTSYSPSAPTSTLDPSAPSAAFSHTNAVPASVSGAAEPHNGSSTSNMLPLNSSSARLPGQLPGSRITESHQSNQKAPDGQQGLESAGLLDTSVLADRGKAFDLFRRSYRKNEVIEENKALLKEKYTTAKALGKQVTDNKQRISELKALIEQRRVQRSMASLNDPSAAFQPEQQPDPAEESAKAQIEQEKVAYKEAFARLRELKQEIEHLQMLLEQSRTKLQRDFEHWMSLMLRQQQTASAITAAGLTQASTASVSPVRSVPRSLSGAAAEPHTGMPDNVLMPRIQSSDRSMSTSSGLRASGKIQEGLYENVSPEVMASARPLLTGNPAADADIIKFYQAKAALLNSQPLSGLPVYMTQQQL
ncbi:TPA: hypothetical protein ACH3X2_006681 [Trebouxia sp. C0005]